MHMLRKNDLGLNNSLQDGQCEVRMFLTVDFTPFAVIDASRIQLSCSEELFKCV